MKYSFIVPIYNVEKYLKKCIDSLLAQTYGSFEIILVDDGSTDSSGAIADEYAGKYSEIIRVIHQSNTGQGVPGASCFHSQHALKALQFFHER